MRRFAESEDPVVAVIPMLVGPRVIGIQPELGAIRVQVEDIRVAIAVCNISRAICATASEIKEIAQLYLIRDRKSTSAKNQVSLFFRDKMQILCRKPPDLSQPKVGHRHSQFAFAGRVSPSRNRTINQSVFSITKFLSVKKSKNQSFKKKRGESFKIQ